MSLPKNILRLPVRCAAHSGQTVSPRLPFQPVAGNPLPSEVPAAGGAHAGRDSAALGQASPGRSSLCTSPAPGLEQVTRAQTPGLTAGVGAAWDASYRGQCHYHNTGLAAKEQTASPEGALT